MTQDDRFGQVLRELRGDTHQKTLETATGVSQPTISNMEKSKAKPPEREVVLKLAKALKLSQRQTGRLVRLAKLERERWAELRPSSQAKQPLGGWVADTVERHLLAGLGPETPERAESSDIVARYVLRLLDELENMKIQLAEQKTEVAQLRTQLSTLVS